MNVEEAKAHHQALSRALMARKDPRHRIVKLGASDREIDLAMRAALIVLNDEIQRAEAQSDTRTIAEAWAVATGSGLKDGPIPYVPATMPSPLAVFATRAAADAWRDAARGDRVARVQVVEGGVSSAPTKHSQVLRELAVDIAADRAGVDLRGPRAPTDDVLAALKAGYLALERLGEAQT